MKLSSHEKHRLEKLHSKTKNGKERDRLKAILLKSEGWTVSMICQALRLHQTTVDRHLKDYSNGKLGLEHGGSESKLNDTQTLELIAHLTENTYSCTGEIILHIQTEYGVEYTVPGLNKWLHRNGFSYKKAKGRPHKADTQAQADFIKKYKRLKRDSTAKTPIIFIDTVHPSQETKLGYGWIRTGETKEVPTTASRTRMNIIGGLNLNQLTQPTLHECERVNADEIIHFLHCIKRDNPRSKMIHLVLDQAGYHRDSRVKEEAKKLKIKLHYLPPYSPNLNPIERLWKIMNEYVRNNRFFKSAKDFKQAIYDFFKITVPNIKNVLAGRINDNFQTLSHANSS